MKISEALYYQWRERLLEGGKAALGTARDKKLPEAAELAEARKRIGQLDRALARKTYELEIAGNSRGTGREHPIPQQVGRWDPPKRWRRRSLVQREVHTP